MHETGSASTLTHIGTLYWHLGVLATVNTYVIEVQKPVYTAISTNYYTDFPSYNKQCLKNIWQDCLEVEIM
jgi:hypothetical protein